MISKTINPFTSISGLHNYLVFNRRTRVLAERVSARLPAGSVLDVGCGDGTIDALIQEVRADVALRGLDVLVRPDTRIPVSPFDGRTLPVDDKSVDTVLLVDVLHHTDNPMVLLREAKRAARQSVVIKDHTADGPLARPTLRFMDWIGNAPHGIALPYNYWPEAQWRRAFDELGLSIIFWERKLGLYPFPASLLFERRLHFIAELNPN
jgi:SAM-dependent methyltransferase